MDQVPVHTLLMGEEEVAFLLPWARLLQLVAPSQVQPQAGPAGASGPAKKWHGLADNLFQGHTFL